MPNFSEVVERAVFLRCGIDVRPLQQWWNSSIKVDLTVEGALKDSLADSLVGDAVWQCLLALDLNEPSRQIAGDWLKAVVAAVERGDAQQLDSDPLWVVWFAETATALRFWHMWAADSNCACTDEVWETGLEFIRNCFPALALAYWKRVCREARHQARRERVLKYRTAKALEEARECATIFGVTAPACTNMSPESSDRALVDWYNAIRDGAILEHFWRDHREYLVRISKVDPSPTIRALIRSADNRSAVTIPVIEKLVQVYHGRIGDLLQSLEANRQ